ncbi:hypothetical protein ACFVJK_28310 [Streptomyces sp. NPDC127172]|uniref:hypothetical protein n=1 Tax=Streptomyces sp. NPDC127172 TaxID=3345382 RepID=UPI00362A1070
MGVGDLQDHRPQLTPSLLPLLVGGLLEQGRVHGSEQSEGIPVSVRTLTACPDEPLYAVPTSRDYSASRTSSAPEARTACASLVLLGQAAGSGMLLDHPTELADVVRAVEKIYDNRHHLRQHPPASTAH